MMDNINNWQVSEPAVVYEVIGEPAVIINGVPPLPSGLSTPIQLDSKTDTGSHSDPCFGEWLEGRKIRKLFGDEYYSGKVVKYDKEANWYRVTYEDGDFEDLEWHELEDVLLPLDFFVPLTTLAMQRSKSERCASVARTTIDRTIKGHTKPVGHAEGTSKLFLKRTGGRKVPNDNSH